MPHLVSYPSSDDPRYDFSATSDSTILTIYGGSVTSTAIWDNWITTSTSSTVWTHWVDSPDTGTTSLCVSYGDDGVDWPYDRAEQAKVIDKHLRRLNAPAIVRVRSPDQVERERLYEERLRIETDAIIAQNKALRLAMGEANARAEKLLLENLTLQQRSDYLERKFFVVTGSSGRRFRVRRGRSGNVDLVQKDGRIDRTFCAHPFAAVPDPDTMLVQKLMLEHDDDEFLRVANGRHPFEPGLVLPVLQ